jgi:hypothetical protein
MTDYLALLSISQKDYLGTKASHDVFLTVPDTVTVAQLATVVNGYNALYGAITGALGLDVQCKIHLSVSGLPVAAVSGIENEKTGLFSFTQLGSRYAAAIDVPAILESKIVNGKIDLTDTDVADWITWLEGPHTTIQAVSKFGNTINPLLSAAITFRKHRRSLNRTSTEPG